jgi:glycosyltransferase involved in cell wall biosynthesis
LDIHVFDDGSIDDTPEICRTFANKITYHRNSINLGYVGNVNECLKLYSHYDWIGILQSDDRHEGNSINQVRNLIQKYPEAGIVFSEINTMNKHGAIYNYASTQEHLFKKGLCAVERCQGQLPCSTTFYRTEAIAKSGLFDPFFPYSADEEYNARIASQYDIIESGVALASYRIHTENTSLRTWKEPDFMNNFLEMRIRMAMYVGMDRERAIRKVQHQVTRDFLSCASILTLNGHPDHAKRYYRYVWDNNPFAVLNPLQLIKFILAMTPFLGVPVLKKMLSLKQKTGRASLKSK